MPVQVGGVVKGAVDVDLATGTALDLRMAVAKLGKLDPFSIKLVIAGKVLKDDKELLSGLKIKPTSKVMVMKVASASEVKEMAKEIDSEEKKALEFDRLKKAAELMAKRTDGGTDKYEKYHFELENQDGSKLVIPERDRQSLVSGMSLHEKGRKLIKKKEYAKAYDVLKLAADFFSITDSKYLNMIDNLAYLYLDIVWCLYLKKDLKDAEAAREYLNKSKAGFERAHGKDLSRLLRVRRGFVPELATYVRLHLMEGIVAFLEGNYGVAEECFFNAKMRARTLEVDPMQVIFLVELGYSEKMAKRALRACEGDSSRALAFLEERKEAEEKRAEAEQRKSRQRKTALKHGNTPSGALIDISMADGIANMGFFWPVAVEAVKRSDNNVAEALALLGNPLSLQDVEQAAISRQLRLGREVCEDSDSFPDKVTRMKDLGYSEWECKAALFLTENRFERSIDLLSNPSFRHYATDLAVVLEAEASIVSAAPDIPSEPSYGVPVDGSAPADATATAMDVDSSAFPESSPAPAPEFSPATEARLEEERKLEDEILEAFDEDDVEAYLDIDIDSEYLLLSEYEGLLTAMKS